MIDSSRYPAACGGVLHRRKFFQGHPIFGGDESDIAWFEPSGAPMGEEGWNAGFNQCFGMRMSGDLIGDVDERGQDIKGNSILILMNAFHEAIPFKIPARVKGQRWQRLIDTALLGAKHNWFTAAKLTISKADRWRYFAP